MNEKIKEYYVNRYNIMSICDREIWMKKACGNSFFRYVEGAIALKAFNQVSGRLDSNRGLLEMPPWRIRSRSDDFRWLMLRAIEREDYLGR